MYWHIVGFLVVMEGTLERERKTLMRFAGLHLLLAALCYENLKKGMLKGSTDVFPFEKDED